MKLAIVGSRSFQDYALLIHSVTSFHPINMLTLIVSGGAEGADSLAQRFAKEHGLPILIHYPNWEKWGKTAGFSRNESIVKDADKILVFWDGQSRGTQDTISRAQRLKKPHDVMWYALRPCSRCQGVGWSNPVQPCPECNGTGKGTHAMNTPPHAHPGRFDLYE